MIINELIMKYQKKKKRKNNNTSVQLIVKANQKNTQSWYMRNREIDLLKEMAFLPRI